MARDVDHDFVRDLKVAVLKPPRLSASLLLFAIIGFFVWAGIWSSRATLDEVTVGIGKIVPSSQLKVIQHLEGGIISEILVREGDVVAEDQPLVQIEAARSQSTLRENRAKQRSLMAVSARLRGEIAGNEPAFPDELRRESPDLIERELDLMKGRQAELDSEIAVFASQRTQKDLELKEHRAKVANTRKSLKLVREEMKIVEPMVAQGVAPKLDLIQLQKERTRLQGDLESSTSGITRAKEALKEIDGKVEQARAAFRAKALAALNETEVNLKVLTETLAGDTDVVKRTKVHSPVAGTVKNLAVTTIGQVVGPGEPLMEIVPVDDSLMVEAKVNPADIAFLSPGLDATVKITAYDFAVYGGLDGSLEGISPDTIVDENGESFYEIRVRTDGTLTDKAGQPLQIIPGMVAEVDILTGQRTVLEYLLKPVLRAKGRALRER